MYLLLRLSISLRIHSLFSYNNDGDSNDDDDYSNNNNDDNDYDNYNNDDNYTDTNNHIY